MGSEFEYGAWLRAEPPLFFGCSGKFGRREERDANGSETSGDAGGESSSKHQSVTGGSGKGKKVENQGTTVACSNSHSPAVSHARNEKKPGVFNDTPDGTQKMVHVSNIGEGESSKKRKVGEEAVVVKT
uniref:Uncharacterized protein n=1 Tax=Nelumbo nucifera TaxID=4432 RepID=A0A822Y9Y5_NELNU|nr:TPA_asm: hypothetical protein HUJ06_029414 [Nelumbo nucifera]